MDLDQFPLSMFEVDCDGSACSSTSVGRHIHPPHLAWYETEPVGRVRIINGERVGYGPAEGIDRLVMVARVCRRSGTAMSDRLERSVPDSGRSRNRGADN